MRADVASLCEVMPPPDRLPGAVVPWESSVGEIGLEFPGDYREFSELYGWGAVRGELSILTPLIPRGKAGWLNVDGGFSRVAEYTNQEIGRAFREMRSNSPQSYPYAIYPEPGGLLAWGRNGNSDHCFWLTKGADPDRWPVVVWSRGMRPSRAWREYDCGMVELIHRIVDGNDPYLNKLLVSATSSQRWVSRMVNSE